MIGDSTLSVEDTSDIFINWRHFKGTRGLWALLTGRNINRALVTTVDLKRYKTILSWPTLICRDTNTGVRCRHRADPSSETLFQNFFLRRGVLAELRYHYGNTGEVQTCLESYTLIPNAPAASRPSNGCMLQREERRWGNWEPGLRHRILSLCIAPFERDFRAILTPWIIL